MTKRTTTAVAVENDRIAPVIEQPRGKAPRKVNPKPCQCGCGQLTEGGDFKPGHDAVLKGRLLAEARSGNQASRDELIRRGWATDESINNPPAKGKVSDEQRAERVRLRLAAKLDQARAAVADLEAQLAGMGS